jgi:hypothetical protein
VSPGNEKENEQTTQCLSVKQVVVDLLPKDLEQRYKHSKEQVFSKLVHLVDCYALLKIDMSSSLIVQADASECTLCVVERG